jgi:hypothetical protein
MKNETKEARFKRVAVKRVQRVIDSFKGLSQCSNKRMYEWNDDHLKKIWAAIDDAYKSCKERYTKAKPEEFSL